MSEMRNFLENEKIAQVSAAMIIVEQANKIKTLEAKLQVAVGERKEFEDKLKIAADALSKLRRTSLMKHFQK